MKILILDPLVYIFEAKISFCHTYRKAPYRKVISLYIEGARGEGGVEDDFAPIEHS